MRVVAVQPGSSGGPEPFDTIVLDAQARSIRRKLITSGLGHDLLVDFERMARLAHGDCLVLDDGRRVEVIAAREELLDVRARDPAHLAQLAWHIGNRHLDAQIETGRILVRRDHVIEDMLKKLGASVSHAKEPFHPEHGAYHSHGH